MKLCMKPDCFQEPGKRTELPDEATNCDMCGEAQPVATGTTTTATVVTQVASPAQQPTAAVDPLVALAGQAIPPTQTTTVVTQAAPPVAAQVTVPSISSPAFNSNRREQRSDRGDRQPRERRPLDENDLRDMVVRGRFDMTTLSALEIGFAAMGKQPLQRGGGQQGQGTTGGVPDTRVQQTPQSTPVPPAHAAYAPPGTAVVGQGAAVSTQPLQGPAFNPLVPPAAAASNPAPSAPTFTSVFCDKCGKRFGNKTDRFCDKCGKKRT